MAESAGTQRTGLVLAGGGARGAYEAGALSVLLPELERRGEQPAVYCGTSVGAMNAALLAGWSHLPVEEALELLLGVWRQLDKNKVLRPFVFRQAPLTALRYVGEMLSIPRVRMPGLLDPEPLKRNLDHWIDWPALHRNVHERRVSAIGFVTTSARTGRTVVFLEGLKEGQLHRSHAIAYVITELDTMHVNASFAVPAIFPPVRVDKPPRALGWYYDGGTRLNAPIKPAIDLGATRLVVVAMDSITGPVLESGEELHDPPDVGDGILHLLEGTLVDPLIEDMRTLGNVNAFFARGDQPGPVLYRTVRGKSPYKEIPYIFVGPGQRGAIGAMASRVFRQNHGGLKSLRSPDYQAMSRLLGGDSPNHAELLSILFFDREYIDELIRMGADDARLWLGDEHDGRDGPWQIGPLQTFTRPRQWTAG